MLANFNNLRRFRDTTSLSSRQVCWAQELSRYHFRIDYRQGKANGAADALSRLLQRNSDEEKVLRAKNTRILYRLLSSLTNASVFGISSTSSSSSSLTPLHQVLICGTNVLPPLLQFWDMLREELAAEGLYKLGGMRLRLQELQEKNVHTQKIRAEMLGKDGWEDSEGILHHQGHFGIEKT